MKNSLGTSVILTLFGESHGPAVGAVLDGLAPGIPVDAGYVASWLTRRRPSGSTDTARVEQDDFRILSGVHGGYTSGTPLTIVIPNGNVRNSDYSGMADLARPSHADYSAQAKYHGYQDKSGGGHFSGRVTAGIVAAGAVCLKALELRGIRIGTHILRCGGVADEPFGTECESQICALENRQFPVLADVAADMQEEIASARSCGDSVGGIIQTAVCGLPAGVGEPWFDSLEGVISRAMFAIGGIKGIEFGSGFGFASMRGSQANDPFRMRDGKVVTVTNNSGGINGGISNGMPVVFNSAVRPTPSIAARQQTVDLALGKDADIEVRGRHDPAIVRRICPVVTCMTAIVLCDQLAMRFGTDWIVQR